MEQRNFSGDIPAGFSLNQQWYVPIWCKKFAVNFGDTKLKKANGSSLVGWQQLLTGTNAKTLSPGR